MLKENYIRSYDSQRSNQGALDGPLERGRVLILLATAKREGSDVYDMLQDLGYAPGLIDVVDSAMEVLRSVRELDGPALVLSDHRLPDMTAIELHRELKRQVCQHPLAFSIMSESVDYCLVGEMLRQGVDDFLSLPARPGELARCVGGQVDRLRQAMRQHEWPSASSFLLSEQQAVADMDNFNRALLQPQVFSDPVNVKISSAPKSQVECNSRIDETALLSLLLLVGRERERLLPDMKFGDPPWDISIELLKMKLMDRDIPVSSACAASSVPVTTSLRWIRRLEQRNCITRWNDPKDKRRDLVSLTPEYAAGIMGVLSSSLKKWTMAEH